MISSKQVQKTINTLLDTVPERFAERPMQVIVNLQGTSFRVDVTEVLLLGDNLVLDTEPLLTASRHERAR